MGYWFAVEPQFWKPDWNLDKILFSEIKLCTYLTMTFTPIVNFTPIVIYLDCDFDPDCDISYNLKRLTRY